MMTEGNLNDTTDLPVESLIHASSIPRLSMTIDALCIIAVLTLSHLRAEPLASNRPQTVVFAWVQGFDVVDPSTARALAPQIIPHAEVGVSQGLDIRRTWVNVQWLVNTPPAVIADDWT